MTLPYSDKAMNYDLDKHRYILNVDYVCNDLGENLLAGLDENDDTNRSSLPKRFLDRASRLIYNYIYSHSTNNTQDFLQFLLAKKEEWRESIKQALEEQTIFMLRNGDLTTFNGINVYKNTKLDITKRDTISGQAIDILENAGILYQGSYYVPINFKKGDDY